MVKFGEFSLPYVSSVGREKMKITVTKGKPSQSVSYRERSGGRGQVFTVNGQILYTTSLPTEPTSIFNLLGTSEFLDFEDGSDSVMSIFSNLKFRRTVDKPKRVYYTATFLEQHNPS